MSLLDECTPQEKAGNYVLLFSQAAIFNEIVINSYESVRYN